MNTENRTYDTRVVPFVRYERVKGKKNEIVVDNITSEESRNMSCQPKLLSENENGVYISDMPLTFNGGTGIKGFLCYVYSEMTKEEQKKFYDRSIVISTTIKSEENSIEEPRRFLRRKRVRERK